MAVFVVVREPGPSWAASRPLREQERWDEHAAFMDGLVEEGFIVLSGPLGDADRALHVGHADSRAQIEARLEQDPWTAMGLLRLASIEPWEILLRSGGPPG